MKINHNKLRYGGNAMMILGHFVMLHLSVFFGVAIKLFGMSIVAYSCKELRLWDVIIVLAFFASIDVSYLIRSL